MASIEKMIAQQKQQQIDDLTREMDEKITGYFASIVEEPVSQIKRLPESTFINSFLPYFCGDQEITRKSNVIAVWVGIAGSITSKVHIVNDKDEILFTVPAINDTSIFDVDNKRSAQGFKNIVLNYKLYANQTPMSAENYLSRTIDGRIDKLRTDSVVFNENEAAWKFIFERYGKVKSAQTVQPSKSNAFDDDELVYD